MLRILFISLIVLILGFFFLQGKLNVSNGVKPAFLVTDKIALNHHTTIQTSVHSLYKPDSLELLKLKTDYSNIWAHLNHLYATNDVEAGKEYYTEEWFKQLVRHYNAIQQPLITRTDEQHELHIQNWASDALICTAIDSNVVLHYNYPNNIKKTYKVNLAVVLLFEGDNWRIDAIRIIDETPL